MSDPQPGEKHGGSRIAVVDEGVWPRRRGRPLGGPIEPVYSSQENAAGAVFDLETAIRGRACLCGGVLQLCVSLRPGQRALACLRDPRRASRNLLGNLVVTTAEELD